MDKETGMYYYGARYYDPRISIFVSVDPLAEKYPNYGGYIYTLNNPIMFIDPDGREVKGVNRDSAQRLHEDMNTVFADKKFDSFRGLLTRGKKNNKITFDKISGDAFKNATNGLTGDDLDAATSVYNAINSDSEFVFEYLKSSDAKLSTPGNKAFIDWSDTQYGTNIGGTLGNEVTYDASSIIKYGGEGLTVDTAKGAHAFIMDEESTQHLEGGKRALTSFHEGFGHGFGIVNKLTPLNNQYNSIRYENMIRKVMGIQTMRDGTNPFHGGGKVPNHLGKPLIR